MTVLAYEYMFAEWVVGAFFLKTQRTRTRGFVLVVFIAQLDGVHVVDVTTYEFDLGLNVVYNVTDVVVATWVLTIGARLGSMKHDDIEGFEAKRHVEPAHSDPR